MRLILVGMIAVTLTACDLKSVLSGDVSVVARAGELELSSDTLADLVAEGKWPVRRDIAEQLAYRWVEFALLGQRLAQGDSLLDSATVFYASWPDAHQWLVDDYRDSLVAQRVTVDSAVVDSAYQAGDHRMVSHILIRTRPDMSPPELQDARVRVGRILTRLTATGDWPQANEENEDPVAKRQGGSLGLIERGRMIPQFDEVAFTLAPGELSGIVETPYGFHIIWRPKLDEVWDAYEEAIRELLTQRMEDAFLVELVQRWDVRVRSNAPAAVREAAAAPLQTFKSSATIGTYRDGKFTTADFVRWLQVLESPVLQGLGTASDEQIVELVRTLMRNEVLVREARESGVTYMAEDFPYLQEELRKEIRKVMDRLALDSALVGAATPEERLRAVDRSIIRYCHDLMLNAGSTVVVPAFLADRLRRDMEWSVSSAAVDQVVERGLALKAEQIEPPLDSENANAPPR